MRVLFINQYYPPDVSATGYLLGELTEDLAAQHEVWVVAGRPSYNPEGSTYQPRGVHVRRAWSTSFRRASMMGRLANYSSFVLGSLIRSFSVPRPDVIVAMTDPPVIALVGLLAAERHRSRLVHVCADLFPDIAVALKRMDHPVVVSLWRRLNRLVRPRCDRVVAVGRDMLERLEADGVPREKLAFLPNWANDAVPRLDEIVQTRRALGWDGRYVVMHAGNMGLAQNLEILVGAAEALRHRPEIRIVFVGDGAAKAGLERAAAERRLDNVEFLPYRPKDQAQAVLAAADLHVVSLARGLWGCAVPSKVYGILGLGLPFVAAVEPRSEVARVVDESGAGVRVEPGNARQMARAIEQFADGIVDGKEAGEKGRREFHRRYERSVATGRYRDLLESVTDL
ncbi:MAG: glycosyltransferase family 4 protein [Actinomycetota bacterium]